MVTTDGLADIQKLRMAKRIPAPVVAADLRAALAPSPASPSEPENSPPRLRDLPAEERQRVIEQTRERLAVQEAARRAAERAEATARRLEAACLPAFHAAKLGTLEPFKDGALDVLKDAVMTGKLCVLHGHRPSGPAVGAGKTQLAVALIDWWVREVGSSARYWSVPRLFIALKAEFGSKPEIVERCIAVPLLVLDEFHERTDGAWGKETLTAIVDGRYADGKPSVVIANETADVFAERVGPSVWSRVLEGGAVLDVSEWPDRRAEVQR